MKRLCSSRRWGRHRHKFLMIDDEFQLVIFVATTLMLLYYLFK